MIADIAHALTIILIAGFVFGSGFVLGVGSAARVLGHFSRAPRPDTQGDET